MFWPVVCLCRTTGTSFIDKISTIHYTPSVKLSMSVPAFRNSRSRVRRRRSHHSLKKQTVAVCPKCETPILPHRACKSCGYYNGRQLTSGMEAVKATLDKEVKKAAPKKEKAEKPAEEKKAVKKTAKKAPKKTAEKKAE